MAERGGWQAANIEGLESYRQLPAREQAAIRKAVVGLRSWRASGQEPKPMRVTVTEDAPFNLRGFAQVLHEVGVGITDSLRQDGENAFVFQPRPYDEESLKRPRIRRSSLSEIDVEALEELLRFFRKPGFNSAF